jgi:hypothetical protein
MAELDRDVEGERRAALFYVLTRCSVVIIYVLLYGFFHLLLYD